MNRNKTKELNDLVLTCFDYLNEENKETVSEELKRITNDTITIEDFSDMKKIKDLKLSSKYMIISTFYNVTNMKTFDLHFFYNSEIKSKFLDKYPNDTQMAYSRIFEKSKIKEEEYKKDIAFFNEEEIEDFLYFLKPLTKSASHVNGRIISVYIDWIIENKKLPINDNCLREKKVSYFNKFIDEKADIYFNYQTLKDIEFDCQNAQDAVLIRLIFEGVMGKSLAEIRNIKKSDVINAVDYMENSIDELIPMEVVDEDESKRIVRLSREAIKLLIDAVEQEQYLKKNGVLEDESIGTITNLVDNDYVVRTSITKTDYGNRPVEKMVIYRRIKMINEVLKYDYLTTKNIFRSGVIYEGKKLLEKNRILDKQAYLQICEKYNIENWYPVKNYCNVDVINKLYYKDKEEAI